VGVLTTARDLTRERAAAELERKAAQAGRCEARLDAAARLAGGIAHDFNNLLTVIHSTAATELEELHPTDPVARSFYDIVSACESARKITLELGALARSQRVDPAPTELGALLRRLRSVLARLAGPSIELVVSPGPAPVVSMIDGPQLERVLVNLVKNAREAGAKRVELSLSREGERAMLVISDDGEGIDPDVLPHVFEPFFTTKHDARGVAGSGLGLASSYAVIRGLGGDLAVTSTKGRGSRFAVLLPASDARADEGDDPPVLEPSTTVLVLDDDPAVRSLAGVLLRRSGFRVLSAANADEASRRVRAEPVDVLLADVVLPGTSGPAVASTLRRERPELRTLFMSGYPAEALTPHGLEPSRPFIAKPFTRSALAAAVKDARMREA
jgi:two-component system cell cycle sensor histidine kinase/response regulator CckA